MQTSLVTLQMAAIATVSDVMDIHCKILENCSDKPLRVVQGSFCHSIGHTEK